MRNRFRKPILKVSSARKGFRKTNERFHNHISEQIRCFKSEEVPNSFLTFFYVFGLIVNIQGDIKKMPPIKILIKVTMLQETTKYLL